MIRLVEGAERQKTPNEIALNILLVGMTHHLRVRHGDHSELRELCRRHHFGRRRGGAVRHAHPDHHRRAAVGHRHRRHGPAGALQRAGDVGPRRRGGGRRRHAAARQDRHHHARQPPGDRIQAAARRERAGTGGRGAACLAGRRDPGRPLDRRARQGEIRHPRARPGRAARQVHSVHGAEPHERRGGRRLVGPQGRGRRDPDYLNASARRRAVRQCSAAVSADARSQCDRRRDREVRRHAARRRQGRPAARRRPPQGHRQGRHPRALRRAAPHGHPHRHDHRRQPDDGCRDRGGGRRRRLPRPGHARGQAPAHPRRAGQGQAGRHVRRRHQRRARARAGRRRRRHEHRHRRPRARPATWSTSIPTRPS